MRDNPGMVNLAGMTSDSRLLVSYEWTIGTSKPLPEKREDLKPFKFRDHSFKLRSIDGSPAQLRRNETKE